ncbi:alpha/beta hydrolase-fold protein [uncultured Paludibaculum sp.]|uniref:esterase n=1 Tax=uncultured Paludibaculum sp. TaxID=1765020 RepID=UPI002AAA9C99|nr:alpha/beta hydrolase-fold protein [uncultured Paludibaculum sp.]
MSRLILALLIAAAAFAQPAARRIVSPEISVDRHITFRLSAPKATEVVLHFGEGALQTHAMTKGEAGIWSVTIGPIEPEIYTYSFLVDGTKVIDLANPIAKIGATIDASVVEIPGDPPRFDQVQAVPHGSMDIHTYPSAVSKTQRGLYVYVPAEYYSEPRKRFPVLYLWHGGGGAELDWSRDGRAGVILDNLIAGKKAVPMLIVMPNNVSGAPAPGVTPSVVPAAGGPGAANYPLLQRELLEEIIPFVAGHYRTIENRESRAMAGLSAGGGTTMNVGLTSLDAFAWIAEFSSGIFGGVASYGPFDIEKIAPGFYSDPSAINRKLKLFYMSCGTEDPRMPFHKKALQDFQSHQIKVTFAEFPGAHEWKVWRHSLADLAPRLFR